METLALNRLAKMTYKFCGLNYLNNLSAMELKVQKRLSALNMPSLWNYIRYLEDNFAEWEPLIEQLTINETYFYREDKQLHVFQNSILPEMSASSDSVKIWSAGCSTGEEPYSLAILAQAYNPQAVIEIDATDINKKVLEKATSGVYNKNSLSFRRIPDHWLNTYFVESENSYEITSSIQQMITFDYLNLLDETANCKNEQYDVIFCRNVLIYFDEETIKKVVTQFFNALKKGGYLFLGHSETISKLNIGFETINAEGTFYYRKG